MNFFSRQPKNKFIPDGLSPEEAVLHHLHSGVSSSAFGDSEDFDKKGFAYLVLFLLLCVVAYFYWGPTVSSYFNKGEGGNVAQISPPLATVATTATATATLTATVPPTLPPTTIITATATATATKTPTHTTIIIMDDIEQLIKTTGITYAFNITQSRQLIQDFGYDVINNVPDYAWHIIPKFGLTQTLSITEVLALAQSGIISEYVSLINSSSFLSPILPEETTTPTPTATPSTNYIIISHDYGPIDDKYPYISGWILESDGETARPAKIDLCHPSACMAYPRPTNTDIASGYYKFLVEPGHFTLKIDNLAYNIHVISTTNQFINLKYTSPEKLETAARSNPWNTHTNQSRPQNTTTPPTLTPTPTPTPTPPKTKIYTPIIIKNIIQQKIETNFNFSPVTTTADIKTTTTTTTTADIKTTDTIPRNATNIYLSIVKGIVTNESIH